jgi:hypothetical protein
MENMWELALPPDTNFRVCVWLDSGLSGCSEALKTLSKERVAGSLDAYLYTCTATWWNGTTEKITGYNNDSPVLPNPNAPATG